VRPAIRKPGWLGRRTGPTFTGHIPPPYLRPNGGGPIAKVFDDVPLEDGIEVKEAA
jgi:hypothetical protein